MSTLRVWGHHVRECLGKGDRQAASCRINKQVLGTQEKQRQNTAKKEKKGKIEKMEADLV